jgi:hypothetical protein
MLMLVFNVILTIVLLREALVAFEQDANHIGWVFVFLSAFNFASLMAEIV